MTTRLGAQVQPACRLDSCAKRLKSGPCRQLEFGPFLEPCYGVGLGFGLGLGLSAGVTAGFN
jgi:hypothetical protein